MNFLGFYWILSRFQPFFNDFPLILLDLEPLSGVFQFFIRGFYWILNRFQPFFNEFPWLLLDFGRFQPVFK